MPPSEESPGPRCRVPGAQSLGCWGTPEVSGPDLKPTSQCVNLPEPRRRVGPRASPALDWIDDRGRLAARCDARRSRRLAGRARVGRPRSTVRGLPPRTHHRGRAATACTVTTSTSGPAGVVVTVLQLTGDRAQRLLSMTEQLTQRRLTVGVGALGLRGTAHANGGRR
jgi:hypothetical protein